MARSEWRSSHHRFSNSKTKTKHKDKNYYRSPFSRRAISNLSPPSFSHFFARSFFLVLSLILSSPDSFSIFFFAHFISLALIDCLYLCLSSVSLSVCLSVSLLSCSIYHDKLLCNFIYIFFALSS